MYGIQLYRIPDSVPAQRNNPVDAVDELSIRTLPATSQTSCQAFSMTALAISDFGLASRRFSCIPSISDRCAPGGLERLASRCRLLRGHRESMGYRLLPVGTQPFRSLAAYPLYERAHLRSDDRAGLIPGADVQTVDAALGHLYEVHRKGEAIVAPVRLQNWLIRLLTSRSIAAATHNRILGLGRLWLLQACCRRPDCSALPLFFVKPEPFHQSRPSMRRPGHGYVLLAYGVP